MEYQYFKQYKNFLIEFTNEWAQLFKLKKYNWVTYTLINIGYEHDIHIKNKEIEIFFLGLGLRICWEYK